MLSSIVDPFDVARDEVEAALRKVEFMRKEWRRLLESSNTAECQRFQDLHAELLGELQQLDYDLQEVQSSIRAVEENRERFQLSDAQLAARRDFMASSRRVHQDIRGELGSQKAAAKMEEDKRKALLSHQNRQQEEQQRRAELEDQAFMQDQQLLQRQLVESQEDELNQLSKTTELLGVTAHTINGELESQQKMLDELNLDIDMEAQRMNILLKGAGQALKTSNKWQIFAIGGLILLFFLLLFLFLNT